MKARVQCKRDKDGDEKAQQSGFFERQPPEPEKRPDESLPAVGMNYGRTAMQLLAGSSGRSGSRLDPRTGAIVQRRDDERPPNKTGLPDRLKDGIENLSGYDLSDVRVNYNSPKPAQLDAHAYTQGTAIEVAPGQERHLPHEAWHVVQQMQGRAIPTIEVNGYGVNGDQGLEQEADVMAGRVMQKYCFDEEAKEKKQGKPRAKQDQPKPGIEGERENTTQPARKPCLQHQPREVYQRVLKIRGYQTITIKKNATSEESSRKAIPQSYKPPRDGWTDEEKKKVQMMLEHIDPIFGSIVRSSFSINDSWEILMQFLKWGQDDAVVIQSIDEAMDEASKLCKKPRIVKRGDKQPEYEYGRDYKTKPDPSEKSDEGIKESEKTRVKGTQIIETLEAARCKGKFMIGVLEVEGNKFIVTTSQEGRNSEAEVDKAVQLTKDSDYVPNQSIVKARSAKHGGYLERKGYDMKQYGTCAFPQLINYAIATKNKPLAVSEIWYNPSNLVDRIQVTGQYGEKQQFEHGTFVPPCDKCREHGWAQIAAPAIWEHDPWAADNTRKQKKTQETIEDLATVPIHKMNVVEGKEMYRKKTEKAKSFHKDKGNETKQEEVVVKKGNYINHDKNKITIFTTELTKALNLKASGPVPKEMVEAIYKAIEAAIPKANQNVLKKICNEIQNAAQAKTSLQQMYNSLAAMNNTGVIWEM